MSVYNDEKLNLPATHLEKTVSETESVDHDNGRDWTPEEEKQVVSVTTF